MTDVNPYYYQIVRRAPDRKEKNEFSVVLSFKVVDSFVKIFLANAILTSY